MKILFDVRLKNKMNKERVLEVMEESQTLSLSLSLPLSLLWKILHIEDRCKERDTYS
jgi:hypothetical protein